MSVRTPAGELLLDGINVRIPAGCTAAVVGRSGSGKTTLGWLTGGLVEPDSGEVLLGGQPVAAIPATERSSAVAYAFARPAVLGHTVAEDIAYGPVPVSRAEIERAAEAASAAGFIRRLPDGYDTKMSGAPFSGGEHQRLGIARALLAKAHLMVLDDATSSLDTATEVQVSKALTAHRPGQTRLVVAHRAATAARADTVVWLDAGKVRALAPHDELWADPEYRAVFQAEPTDATGVTARAEEPEQDAPARGTPSRAHQQTGASDHRALAGGPHDE